LLLDSLRAEPCTSGSLAPAALDLEALEVAMCSWPPKH
jgi:hypothetical protein